MSPRRLRLRRVAAVALLAASAVACSPSPSGDSATEAERTGLAELLGAGSEEGFSRAVTPRPFVFPEDHGPHPEFKAEWWYLTGHLEATDDRRFGYQATIFRSAVQPQAAPGESAWRTNQLYMGHFAVTDLSSGRFRWHERFSRGGGAGLAGARAEPFRVWLDDWEIAAPAGGPPPFTLRFAGDEVALELTLEAEKPRVLQGDRGLSKKGSRPGNASYYYAYTRLASRGSLTVEGEALAVEGLSWMDREWSTSALEPGVVGWDWFSLQLDDDRELMVYQLRRADGTPDPASSGSLIDVDGGVDRLDAADATIEVLDRWRSPETGARYPARWRIEVPRHELDLEVTPMVAAQELTGTVIYWEGAVEAEGSAAGRPVSGRGYVELTGYDRTP